MAEPKKKPVPREASAPTEPSLIATPLADLLPREQLEQHLYSWGHEVESNAVEVHIHRLRRKLGSELIQTVRGAGYVIKVE